VNEIRIGDCRAIMKCLVLQGVRVQTCITSPPYFGLRDYGVEGQLGMEETPAEYVGQMVDVFRLVRELLADDGTVWLNLGDSYAGSWGAQSRGDFYPGTLEGASSRETSLSARQILAHPKGTLTGSLKNTPGLKPKDLIGIPWRVAFALQADGWYLRSDIIWHKPNPMPESVTDRPTKSHEYIFLLSKSADYFYDAAAIREPAICGWNGNEFQGPKSLATRPTTGRGPRPSAKRGEFAGKTIDLVGREAFRAVVDERNKRSVWQISTQPYAGAHFATFPPDLILPCVLAGSRPNDIVFDPFMGSGTTALVAKENGRRYLGCELNPAYASLQNERLRQEVLFAAETPA
jgi:DNA modification methylase